MPNASAHRPHPVTMPATNAMIPRVATIARTDLSASWIALVDSRAKPKPVSKARAFTRHGEGKSLMLPPMAPRVAG